MGLNPFPATPYHWSPTLDFPTITGDVNSDFVTFSGHLGRRLFFTIIKNNHSLIYTYFIIHMMSRVIILRFFWIVQISFCSPHKEFILWNIRNLFWSDATENFGLFFFFSSEGHENISHVLYLVRFFQFVKLKCNQRMTNPAYSFSSVSLSFFLFLSFLRFLESFFFCFLLRLFCSFSDPELSEESSESELESACFFLPEGEEMLSILPPEKISGDVL